jgi:predicted nucleotidyltransferase
VVSKEIVEFVTNFEEINQQYKIIYLTEFGSKLYGTNTENSDLDIKGIFIPCVQQVLLKKDKNRFSFDSNKTNNSNTKDDMDFELISIYKFFDLLIKGETTALDILFSMFSNKKLYCLNSYINHIKDNYNIFLSTNMHSFKGYAISQTMKYHQTGNRLKEISSFMSEVSNFDDNLSVSYYYDKITQIIKHNKYTFISQESPNGDNKKYIRVFGKYFIVNMKVSELKDKLDSILSRYGNRTKNILSGSDFKAVSHSYRVLCELEELLVEGKITFPLKEASLIKEIKRGKFDTINIVNILENKLNKCIELEKDTILPKNPDIQKIDSLLLSLILN